MKRLTTLLAAAALTLSASTAHAESFRICWSIYVGWMPWGYADNEGIVDKWADKYDIDIEIVQINDYIESINQYTAGQFDGCSMTNMDALTIPAAGGVDSTALIVGDFSDGNDGVILKGTDELSDIEGRRVNLVELSVSHYLLARALESVDMRESDVQVVHTSDADMVSIFGTRDVTAVTTWNPLLNEILSMPEANKVFDSSSIPGEIMDLMVVNTDTLAEHPELGKALVGAWYETMARMSDEGETGTQARTAMGEAAGTDLAGYQAQLDTTRMFYQPEAALELVNSEQLLDTMQRVAEFSFEHGLLGQGAPDAGYIGVEGPQGIYGNEDRVYLRFDPTFMQMAADGEL